MLYKLSRFSPIHTALRKISYSILWNVPDSLKYTLFSQYLRRVKPYSVVSEGDTVIQVGAPWDILKSGRSRALHFAILVGGSGKVFAVEPVKESIEKMTLMLEKLKIESMTQIKSGAWTHKDTLSFLVDKENPAANIVDDVVKQDRGDLERFSKIEIEVDSLENLLSDQTISTIRLLSLTTNGSEDKIISGLGEKLRARVEYVSVIDDPRETTVYSDFGFDFFAEDDRGYLLRNRNFTE